MADVSHKTRNLLIILLTLVAFLLGRNTKKPAEPRTIVTTDTIVVVDTISIDKPTEITRYVVRKDTFWLDKFILVINDDTTPGVEIPIEQAIYQDSVEDVAYTAYVSGFHPQLDSISISHQSAIIQPTITEKPSRWSIGVQVGLGANKKGLTPYVGVGLQYRLWQF